MVQALKPGEHGAISVSQRPNGAYRARARLRLFDGTEVQVARHGPTKAAARTALQNEITERLRAPAGSRMLRPDAKVGLAARQWIEEARLQSTWPRPPIRPQTLDEYERLLGNHLVPKLGRMRLNQLTPAVCQSWVNGIVEAGRSGPTDMVATANQAAGVFRKVLDRAVQHDAMRDNPMRKVALPRKDPPVPRALTALDVYKLRKAVRDWEASRQGRPGPRPTGNLPAAVDVMLGTGLRIGEAMSLRWGDVDLIADRPTITVSATLVDIRGTGTIRQEHPKTKAGERRIIIPPFTVESLKAIRPPAPAPEVPVFPSRGFKDGTHDSRPQTTHNLRRTLREALELAGMSGSVHPHLLRATVATFVARRMSVADAAGLLGHKIDVGVTARHYIERLTLAPDTSAVLQAFIELGEAEARAEETGGWERPRVGQGDSETRRGGEWSQPRFDWNV